MMKPFLYLCLILPQLAFAQISAEETYTSFIAPKNPEGPERQDRWMVDLSYSSWLEYPSNIELKPFGHSIGVQRMIDLPLNKKSTFGFAIGFGFNSQNYYHNGAFAEQLDSLDQHQGYTIVPLPAGYEFKRNKISFNYLEIPVQIRIRSSKKWHFFFYPGFKAGWLFNDHTKIIDDSGKYKRFGFKGFTQIQYGPTLHIGFNRFAVYGFYSLTPILKDGPAFSVFSLGISLNFF